MLKLIKYTYENWFQIFLLFFILFGVSVAFLDLIQNKSLWLDEACLALNIVSKSYMDLLNPLDYGQVSPIGFLFIEKFLFDIFGFGEWVLRLFPFVCFFVSIYIFFNLNLKLFSSIKISLIACVFFSLNFTLINYASEVKQYSVDVLFSILIILSSLNIKNTKTVSAFILHTCLGVVAIWFSNIAVIVLLSCGIYDIYYGIFSSSKKSYNILFPIFLWITSFIFYYIFFISDHPHTSNMTSYWTAHFMPNKIFSNEFNVFVYKKTKMIFSSLLNFKEKWIFGFILYVLGILLLLKEKKIKYLYLICFPIIIHLILSLFHLYPFYERFILYLIPLIIIPVSYSFKLVLSCFHKFNISKIIITLILLIYTYELLNTPRIDEEEIKKSLSFINKYITNDDHIYVYYSSKPAFEFYKKNYLNVNKAKVIHFGGFHRGKPKGYLNEIKNINNSTWILFSHMYTEGYPDRPPETEEDFIINNLKKNDYKIVYKARFKDSSCYKIESTKEDIH